MRKSRVVLTSVVGAAAAALVGWYFIVEDTPTRSTNITTAVHGTASPSTKIGRQATRVAQSDSQDGTQEQSTEEEQQQADQQEQQNPPGGN